MSESETQQQQQEQQQQQQQQQHIPESLGGFIWEVLVGSPTSPQSSSTSPELPSASSKTQSSTASPTSGTESTLWNTLDYFASFVYPVITSPSDEEEVQEEQKDEQKEVKEEDTIEDTAEEQQQQLPEVVDDFSETRFTPGPSKLLSVSIMNSIRRTYLPNRYRDYDQWKLVYSFEQNGTSIHTFYDRMREYCDTDCSGLESQCPSLMVIKSDTGAVFGCFVLDLWKKASGTGSIGTRTVSKSLDFFQVVRRSFYGTGESFLFQVDQDSKNELRVYQWTQNNDYIQLSEQDFLAMGGGGGGGRFSLYLDGDLYKGYTASSPTFSNTHPLSSASDSGGEFKCVDMEVWGISLL